jgi:hypothetical protein
MRVRFVLIGLLLGVTGCGGAKYAPVSGRVLLDGKPVANATVVFTPDAEKNPGPGSKGKTDKDGRFTLETMTGDQKGALVGVHKVSITAYEGDEIPDSSGQGRFAKRIVGDDYNSNTKLTFEVKPGGTTDANFEVSGPAK